MRAQGKEALPYEVDLQGRPSKVSPFSGPHRDTTLVFSLMSHLTKSSEIGE